jgi:GNAT superfamily N-acetyltransferase
MLGAAKGTGGNPCHEPGGSPIGGHFARKGAGICHPIGQSKTTTSAPVAYRATPQIEARWAADFGRTGVTLQDLINAYAAGLAPPASGRTPGLVKWDGDLGAYIFTVVSGGAMVQRNIKPGYLGSKPTVYHEALLLQTEHQTRGLGKRMIAETFRLYSRLGVTEVNLQANIDIGSYAWARYGFDFDPISPQRVTAFQNGTLARANVLADWGVLSAEQARDLAKASVTPGGGIWKVADTRMKVATSVATRVVDTFLSTKPAGASQPVGDGLTVETRALLRADAAAGVIPIGKLLLLDRFWNGRFRMNNPAQRDRLRAYVGRDVFKD